MNSASIKAKGRGAENAVVEWLQVHGFPFAERRRLTGVQDRGDIAGVPGVCIEVKNCARTDLAGWMAELEEEIAHAGAETGVVVHKRRGSSSAGTFYATMPFWRYVDLLRRYNELWQRVGDK